MNVNVVARRTNGSGRRPGDTTIRIPRALADDIRKLQDSDPWFSTMSVASMLQEIIDGFYIRRIIHGTLPSAEIRDLRKLAGKTVAEKQVYTLPRAGQRGGWR